MTYMNWQPNIQTISVCWLWRSSEAPLCSRTGLLQWLLDITHYCSDDNIGLGAFICIHKCSSFQLEAMQCLRTLNFSLLVCIQATTLSNTSYCHLCKILQIEFCTKEASSLHFLPPLLETSVPAMILSSMQLKLIIFMFTIFSNLQKHTESWGFATGVFFLIF